MQDLKQDWPEVKRRLRASFPILTEEELDGTRGERSEVVALMEMRLGYSQDNAESDLDHFLEGDHDGQQLDRRQTPLEH